ncbi:dihydrodipicolinate synthase family protein [Paenibacillus sp. CGMCC 1.16610]|uniref:N-acetylneuraminate lyase n=1 Tax=Paenibacillus anseongense TaxID=2682845 RepID=A0ABW9UKN4_9BACL|nr:MULTISPECIES: dihydrodipicolinate synthase family protein [Paenibacillus]MBA2939606.1 dihydrodipicolinate synthase family protein [Paenibacillus sp. CGMCC 1.16610]MVQ39268.1 N-acetylneuraminate lyase [Paenibacillus anseongense]
MKTYDLDRFKGITVAMYSCYDEKGEVSKEAAKKLARHYANIGVNGLYVGGSSGEGMLQNVEERKQTLEAVMEEVGQEMTIIAHVGAPSTRDSVELSKHAEQVGAHAISAVPSIYYRLSPQSVEHHWQQMIDSTTLPFIIYHIPQTTGFQLSKALLTKMAAQDKVIGVKISAESTFELQQFKAAGGDDFLVFNGPDEQYLAGRSIGADGGIGGTYGVMPELFMKIERCYVEGKAEEARKWQFIVNDLIAELLSFPSLYGACKEILKLRGLNTGEARLPFLPVPEAEMGRLEAINEKMMAYINQAQV